MVVLQDTVRVQALVGERVQDSEQVLVLVVEQPDLVPALEQQLEEFVRMLVNASLVSTSSHWCSEREYLTRDWNLYR